MVKFGDALILCVCHMWISRACSSITALRPDLWPFTFLVIGNTKKSNFFQSLTKGPDWEKWLKINQNCKPTIFCAIFNHFQSIIKGLGYEKWLEININHQKNTLIVLFSIFLSITSLEKWLKINQNHKKIPWLSDFQVPIFNQSLLGSCELKSDWIDLSDFQSVSNVSELYMNRL